MSLILIILCSNMVHINLHRGSQISVILSILCSYKVYTNLYRVSHMRVILSILCSTILIAVFCFLPEHNICEGPEYGMILPLCPCMAICSTSFTRHNDSRCDD